MYFKQFKGQNVKKFRASRIENPFTVKFRYLNSSRTDFFKKYRSYEKFLCKNAAKNREEISFPLFQDGEEIGIFGQNIDHWFSLKSKNMDMVQYPTQVHTNTRKIKMNSYIHCDSISSLNQDQQCYNCCNSLFQPLQVDIIFNETFQSESLAQKYSFCNVHMNSFWSSWC